MLGSFRFSILFSFLFLIFISHIFFSNLFSFLSLLFSPFLFLQFSSILFSFFIFFPYIPYLYHNFYFSLLLFFFNIFSLSLLYWRTHTGPALSCHQSLNLINHNLTMKCQCFFFILYQTNSNFYDFSFTFFSLFCNNFLLTKNLLKSYLKF